MQTFAEGDRIRVVDHEDHTLPPALEGCDGWRGNIAAVKGDDLYDVRLDDDDPVPTVQLHAEQLASYGERVCRECGCTNDRPCTRRTEKSTWTCGWAEPDLCTACTPDARPGWVHPSADGEG